VNDLVSLDAIREAAARIRGVARVTPLIDASDPANPGARRFFLKCENLQPAGAFKIRGAYNMIAKLPAAERAHGVITYSSGNHGQAVALAARLLNTHAVIVMPTTAPAIKVAGAKGFGAEVVLEGKTSADRKQRAEAIAAERGLVMVPPFDHPWIIAGQATAGLEILDQCPDVSTVFVQVGGGGLASGVATAIKSLRPEVQIVGVEPVGAPKMKRSIDAGHPVTLERTASIADGLLPVRPGDLTFAHVRAFVDRLVTVDDDQIVAAVRWLFREAKIVVEPSGAVSVAAALSDEAALADGKVVAVLSGGNIETELFVKIVSESFH
jgi:threonine dehydratase